MLDDLFEPRAQRLARVARPTTWVTIEHDLPWEDVDEDVLNPRAARVVEVAVVLADGDTCRPGQVRDGGYRCRVPSAEMCGERRGGWSGGGREGCTSTTAVLNPCKFCKAKNSAVCYFGGVLLMNVLALNPSF